MDSKLVVVLFLMATLIGGCSHQIMIEPDLTKIASKGEPSEISALVAYYIPPESLKLEVTNPMGSGDNIRYFPYRDVEMGYEQALRNVFNQVVKLSSTPDFSQKSQQKPDYIIYPEIVTSSASSDWQFWPPTDFTVAITTNILDSAGNLVANPKVVGIGAAQNERLSDPGFAGRRAMEDALSKTQDALNGLSLFSQTKTNVVLASSANQVSEKKPVSIENSSNGASGNANRAEKQGSAMRSEQPLDGIYVVAGSIDPIRLEQTGTALHITESGERSTYILQKDGSYHYLNPNTGITSSLRVLPGGLIEADRVPSSGSPSHLYRAGPISKSEP